MSVRAILPHPLISAVFIVSFLCYCFFGHSPLGNPDVPWHLASGKWMLDHHSFLGSNIWAYSAENYRWVNITWLWDIALAALFSLGGVKALAFMAAAMGAINVALVTYTLRARAAVETRFILATALVVWFVQLMGLYPQAGLVTVFMTCLFHHFLSRQRWDGKLDRRCAIVLPLLMIVWANMHGGFFVAYTLFIAYGMEAWEQKKLRVLKGQIELAILCFLASLITPNGIHIYSGVVGSVSGSLQAYISEWYPFTFGAEMPFSVLLALFALTGHALNPRVRLADKIIAFGWLLAAMNTRRSFMIFAVAVAPYLSVCMEEFILAARKGKPFPPVKLRGAPSPVAGALLAGGVFLLVLLTPFSNVWLHEQKLNPDPYGTRAAMEALTRDHPHARLLADYNLGGYLIYHSNGAWPVYVDGRAGTAYPDKVLADYVDILKGSDNAPDILAHYGAQGVLLLRSSAQAIERFRYDPAHWQEIYASDALVAYLKKQ